MTARRRLAPEARRQEILDAALTVLAERGVEARVEDVVRAAGAAKGTFYLYFSSWQDLIAAAREQEQDKYRVGMLERLADAPGDWWTAFLDELTFFVDYLLDMGPMHEALFHGPLDSPTPRGQSAPHLISDILRDGIASGTVEAEDPDAAALLVFELAHGAADAVKRGADRDRTLAELRRFVRRGLSPPGF